MSGTSRLGIVLLRVSGALDPDLVELLKLADDELQSGRATFTHVDQLAEALVTVQLWRAVHRERAARGPRAPLSLETEQQLRNAERRPFPGTGTRETLCTGCGLPDEFELCDACDPGWLVKPDPDPFDEL